MTAATRPHRGYSVRRPRGNAKGPVADSRAEVVSRHQSARSALVALRTTPRDPAGGYTDCFLFDEKLQVRISNFAADTGPRRRK